MPTRANLFARIPGDWKYDWTEFQRACQELRLNPQTLHIERVDGGVRAVAESA